MYLVVLFTLKAQSLASRIAIPSDRFRPLSTTVTFSAETPNLRLQLTLPRWNTRALSDSAMKHVLNVGHLPVFTLDGGYTYHADVREDCVDQLNLNMTVRAYN